MYYVYILQSSLNGSRYVGTTTDLKNRLKEHNSGETRSNKANRPFKLRWYCAFRDRKTAYGFEKYLKSSSGHAFMNKRLL